MKTKITFKFEDWCKLCGALECAPDMGIEIPIIKANHFNKRSRHTPQLLEACKAFIEAYTKSLQMEKSDVAVRMARKAIEDVTGEIL